MWRIAWLFLLIVCAADSLCMAAAPDNVPTDLRTISTTHYLIHTDLEPELADDLAHRMDAMWDEYARRLIDFSPPEDSPQLEAYLFERRHDYMRLTGDRFPNTGGIFIPSENLLAVYLETQGRDGIRRTLQHEAFHQFAVAAIGGDLPIWLNEGIAQIFEEGIWNGKTFLIGQVPPNRVAMLQDDIRENRITEFGSFIARSDSEWSSNLRYRPIATTQYNQAWAMAQFLIFATDENGQPKYRQRLLDMLHLIRAGESGRHAFTDAFSDNTAGFQHLFNEWAHNLSPTAEAAYSEHQAVLADMLISLDGAGRQFADIAAFRDCLDAGGYRLRTGDCGIALPSTFFCDLSGRVFGPSQLFFASTPGKTVPDIICRPADDLQLRTHFLRDASGAIGYETVVESR